jgi:hypothetical protein
LERSRDAPATAKTPALKNTSMGFMKKLSLSLLRRGFAKEWIGYRYGDGLRGLS